MNKKSVSLLLLCHLIWGFQSLFWALITGADSLAVLAFRIMWSAAFTVLVLACTKQLHKLVAVFKDWSKMKYMIPAAMTMLLDWGLYIFAVKSGHVLDTSLGYFMSPLVTMIASFFIFREKLGTLQLISIGLAAAGVVISAVQFGSVPVISIILALISIYACLKKLANVEPLVSIAVETLMMLPFALVYMLFFNKAGIDSFSLSQHALFAASGIVTAIPMVLYAVGINELPMLMVGFSQYISPSIGMLCGLMLGETVTADRFITFAFVWAGIAVYMYQIVREEREKKVVAE